MSERFTVDNGLEDYYIILDNSSDIRLTGVHNKKIANNTYITERQMRASFIDELAAYENIGTMEEYAALKQAEQEGRMHIGKFSDGTIIYVIYADEIDIKWEIGEETYICGWTELALGQCNEDYFLTRKAARAALAAKEGEY